MVVIEQEPKDADETVAANPPNASTLNENGDVFDGFETASERGVSDNESDDEQKLGDQPIPLNDAPAQLCQNALAEANKAKLEGNNLFGKGNCEEALLQYEVALRAASMPLSTEMASAQEVNEVEFVPEKKEVHPPPELTELRSICHSNRGVCFLKLGKV